MHKIITDFFQIPPETFVECYNSTDLTTNFQTITPELSLILCLMTRKNKKKLKKNKTVIGQLPAMDIFVLLHFYVYE